MRGWTIALFLVVAVSFFVDLPPSWAPHIRAVSHYTTPVFLLGLHLFMLPGRWVMLHLWSGFFDLTWRDIWRGAGFIITQARFYDLSRRMPPGWHFLGLPIDWIAPIVVPGQDDRRGANIDIGAERGQIGHQLQIVRHKRIVIEVVLGRP